METLHKLGVCKPYPTVLQNVDMIGRQAVIRIATWRSVNVWDTTHKSTCKMNYFRLLPWMAGYRAYKNGYARG